MPHPPQYGVTPAIIGELIALNPQGGGALDLHMRICVKSMRSALCKIAWSMFVDCIKGKVVFTQFGYLSFLLLVCIVKHSGVPLPALYSTEIKHLIRLSRTLVDVMGEYFANEIVQSCGKGYETEVTKMG